ncbi:MAG: sigma-54-dependent Fis family transcriptional regulator [Gammaproteobacteria bacterium]|nr:sigma-54-dependent Fis family transcriptional regulator [Gammaproteobacteria bacterium]
MNSGYILIVDDEPEICRLVREILEDEHYRVATAANADLARELYRKQRPDMVLLDIWMPGTDGITLLKEWCAGGRPEVPVVMMSGHGTVETAVEATRLGAYDFIEKPVSMGKLLVTVEHVLAAERLRRENLQLKRAAEPDTFLVGKSVVMQQLRKDLQAVAAADTWALILGEPGSGRIMAARYLHLHSARQNQPLIEVSLGAVAAANVAIKLFGAEQNDNISAGSFEQAADGTLVLNDIGELTSATQLQLLHALQEKRFMRVGGREPLPMQARIIAISDPSLPDAVADGRFREDLYYRLNVVPLRIPPLRDHREDVPDLVNVYLDWLVDSQRLAYRRFTTGALNALRNYPWPGNIRELMNVVQRLLILNRGDEVVETEVEQALGGPPRADNDALPYALFNLPLRTARDQFEKAYLEHHLTRTHGNVAEVARLSEMERTHLYRKLKNLGINPKSIKE